MSYTVKSGQICTTNTLNATRGNFIYLDSSLSVSRLGNVSHAVLSTNPLGEAISPNALLRGFHYVGEPGSATETIDLPTVMDVANDLISNRSALTTLPQRLNSFTVSNTTGGNDVFEITTAAGWTFEDGTTTARTVAGGDCVTVIPLITSLNPAQGILITSATTIAA